MLRLYLSETGLHSCLGSEKRIEVLDFLEKAGARTTPRQLRQTCGYWWVELRGDRHLAAMKAAHGGIPRLNYRDLAFLSIRLLGGRLGQRWKVKDTRSLNESERARSDAARREIRTLETRRAL